MLAFTSVHGGLSTPERHHQSYRKLFPLAFPDSACPLCGKAVASQAHIFAECEHLKTARRRATRQLTDTLSSRYTEYGFSEAHARTWIRKSCLLKAGTWLPNTPRHAPKYSLGIIPPQARDRLSPYKLRDGSRSLADPDRLGHIQMLVWQIIMSPLWDTYQKLLRTRKKNFAARLAHAYDSLTPAQARQHMRDFKTAHHKARPEKKTRPRARPKKPVPHFVPFRTGTKSPQRTQKQRANTKNEAGNTNRGRNICKRKLANKTSPATNHVNPQQQCQPAAKIKKSHSITQNPPGTV